MENGAIYIYSPSSLESMNDIYKEGTFAYVMDRFSSIDIDEEEDFMLAQLILEHLSN